MKSVMKYHIIHMYICTCKHTYTQIQHTLAHSRKDDKSIRTRYLCRLGLHTHILHKII